MRKTWVFVFAVIVIVAFMLPVLGFGAEKAAKPKKVVKFGQ